MPTVVALISVRVVIFLTLISVRIVLCLALLSVRGVLYLVIYGCKLVSFCRTVVSERCPMFGYPNL